MEDYWWKLTVKYGTEYSGHWGHLGRPGKRGGSLPRGAGLTAGASTRMRRSAELFKRILEDGGFTNNPVYDDSPTVGFAVSIFPDAEYRVGIEELNKEDVYKYLSRHRDKFEDPTVYAGGWLDIENGIVYLDLSVVLGDRERAIGLAKKHNQEGIYDLGKGETIIVKEEEERRRTIGAGSP